MKKLLLITTYLISSISFAASWNLPSETPMDILIHADEISSKIQETAKQISEEYKDKDLTIIMILKGAICVTSDLIRELDIPFTLNCISASSYGQNGMKNGTLIIKGLENIDLEDKDVLVIDDIFETGNTMLSICKEIEKQHPKSLKTLVLLHKTIEKQTLYKPDYILFNIPNRFVIGYGLDYKEFYRGIPDICAFIGDKAPF
jgi:hypoxanthine phosphoribosyltransferase